MVKLLRIFLNFQDFFEGWVFNLLNCEKWSESISHSVVSDSLRSHGLQHARLPCPAPTPEPTQTHVHCVGDSIQPSHPLSSPFPPALNLSQHQGLFHESVLHIKWPKCWSFSFSISPSNEYSGLTSFRMDWFILLAVQGILMSLLQHHSSKASILWLSAFFILQLSHPYVITGKIIALTKTFVDKVMSLLYNLMSRLVITSLPRSKHLLISCLQSPSTVILEHQKIKSATVSPSKCHEVMGLDTMILVFWMLCFKLTLSLSHFHQAPFFFTFFYKGGVMIVVFNSRDGFNQHRKDGLFQSTLSGLELPRCLLCLH